MQRRTLLTALPAFGWTTICARRAAAQPSESPSENVDDDERYPFALPAGTLADLQHQHDPIVMERVFPVTPSTFFRVLAAPEPWPRWLSLVEGVHYRDARREVGCERDVTVLGGGVIREHFIRWTPAEQFSFYVSSTTSDLLAFFMEDYVLRPVAGGRTRLRWTVQLRLKPPFSAATSMAKAAFRNQGLAGLARLATLLETSPNLLDDVVNTTPQLGG